MLTSNSTDQLFLKYCDQLRRENDFRILTPLKHSKTVEDEYDSSDVIDENSQVEMDWKLV